MRRAWSWVVSIAPLWMKIEQVTFDPFPPLVSDYFFSFSHVSNFFTYAPLQGASFKERSSYLDQCMGAVSREQLSDVLKAYHNPELGHPAIAKNLERLRDPKSVVVIGGQQAGLLTGPLYTIYKAITLIQLARREEKRLGRPVIPVFWIAGEDHDLDEVDHIYLLRSDHRIIKHRLSLSVEERVSIGMVTPPSDVLQTWLDELALLLPDSEYKQEILTELRGFAEGAGLTRFFARIMHRLFASYGLLLIDSSFAPLRQLEAPFFQQIIEENECFYQAVSEQIKEITKQGYQSQVILGPDDALLFIYIENKRQGLVREGEHFVTRDGAYRWSKQELFDLAGTHPERFSNNVITRPLMQEFLFPTLAFVGGPGEIAYWGLLGQAFSQAKLQMPPVVPRMRFTLLDRQSQKAIEKFGLTFDDVFHRLEEKEAEWLAAHFPLDVDQLMSDFRTQLMALYGPLQQRIFTAVPEVKSIGEANQRKILGQVDYLENEVKKALTKRYAQELGRFQHLGMSLLPQGKPQERVYNLFSYLNTYGATWLEQLLTKPLLSPDHKMVYL